MAQALAEGESGVSERENLEKLKWFDRIRKPTTSQLNDMVCATYLADAGLVESPGPLSPGYNAIDAALRVFGFTLAFDNALASDNTPGSQSISRAVAMVTLGWLARTLNLSATETWSFYDVIAKRFPLGVKDEGTESYEKKVRGMLASGNWDLALGPSRLQNYDMLQVEYCRPDGSRAIPVGETEYDSECRLGFCAAVDDVIDFTEETLVLLLQLGPEGRPPSWQSIFDGYPHYLEALLGRRRP